MICYRDMTFCPFWRDCDRADACERPLTDEVDFRAKMLDLPIAEFTEMPDCHSSFVGGEEP